MVFHLLLGVTWTTLFCFGTFQNQGGCFETGKVSRRLRKVVSVSDRMTCEERLRELSLCSQAERRVRGGTVQLLEQHSYKGNGAILFSVVPDDVAMGNDCELWSGRSSIAQQGCRASLPGALLGSVRQKHGQLILSWWWPCPEREAR